MIIREQPAATAASTPEVGQLVRVRDRHWVVTNVVASSLDDARHASHLVELSITVRDDETTEERYVTIGVDAVGRLLVVVYTWRGDRPRLISARQATPQEREQYGSKS